jgi:hypothetical protein
VPTTTADGAEQLGRWAVRAEVLNEPELEFGGAGRHVDPRFGISNYGPADLDEPERRRPIRVGLIGPADSYRSSGPGLSDAETP